MGELKQTPDGAAASEGSWWLTSDKDRVDTEHATINQLIDELKVAIASEHVDRVRLVAGRLIRELSLHFADEEAVMHSRAYPQERRHRQNHDTVRHGLRTLEQEIDSGDPSFAVMAAAFEAVEAIIHRGLCHDDASLMRFLQGHPPAG